MGSNLSPADQTARARVYEGIAEAADALRAAATEAGNLRAERNRLRAVNAELVAALSKIAEVCNGYGDEAGGAAMTARAALGSEAARAAFGATTRRMPASSRSLDKATNKD